MATATEAPRSRQGLSGTRLHGSSVRNGSAAAANMRASAVAANVRSGVSGMIGRPRMLSLEQPRDHRSDSAPTINPFCERPKPWERKSDKGKGKIRLPLPSVESYEKELAFKAVAPARVLIRLERLLGSDRIRINDPKYLRNLTKKIEEEEKRDWNKRLTKRRQSELDRYENLIVNGILQPDPEDEHLYEHHPMYRVFQAMKRVSKLNESPNGFGPVESKLPPITPVEPFEEHKETGHLFYSHPDHYLKKRTPAGILKSTESSRITVGPAPSKIREVQDIETPVEWEGEGAADRFFENYESHKLLSRVNLGNLMRGGDPSLGSVSRALGLNSEQLEKRWGRPRSRIVEPLFTKEMDDLDASLPYASQVSDTYKRESKRAEEFCSTKHRKLFQAQPQQQPS